MRDLQNFKFFLSSGEYLREKIKFFSPDQELMSSRLLVVCQEPEEKIVGACGIRGPLNVLFLYVKESYRNRGLGTQLLGKALQAAKERHLSFVTLTVSADSHVALNLYRRFGFQEVLFLAKSRQILMMHPLTRMGKLAYAFFSALRFLRPHNFLFYAHGLLYRRTL